MAYGQAGMSGLSVPYHVVQDLSTERGRVSSLSQEVRDVRARLIRQECVRHKGAEVRCHISRYSNTWTSLVIWCYNWGKGAFFEVWHNIRRKQNQS